MEFFNFIKKKSLRVVAPVSCFFSFGCIFIFTLNPGPKNMHSSYNFSICHWNLSRTSANNFAKVNLLEASNAIHEFDIICLSGRYLNSSLFSDNNNLSINDYKLARADHPVDLKKSGTCVYIKES